MALGFPSSICTALAAHFLLLRTACEVKRKPLFARLKVTLKVVSLKA